MAKLLFHSSAFGHVAHDALDLSIGEPSPRHLAGEIGAILPANRPLGTDILPLLDNFSFTLERLHLGSIDHIGRRELQQFFAGIADHRGGCGIHVDEPSGRISHKDAVVRLLYQEPEVFFSLPEESNRFFSCFLGPHTLSHIKQRCLNHGLALNHGDQGAIHQHPEWTAVSAPEFPFLIYKHTALLQFRQKYFSLGWIAIIIARLLAPHFCSGLVSEHTSPSVVAVEDKSAERNDPDAGYCLLKKCAIALLGSAEGRLCAFALGNVVRHTSDNRRGHSFGT